MRTLINIVLYYLIFNIGSVKAQDSLIINGKIDKSLNHKYLAINIIYGFQYDWNKIKLADTCEIIDGKFRLKIPVKTYESYKITLIENRLNDSLRNDRSSKQHTAYFNLKPTFTIINFLDTVLQEREIIGNYDNKRSDSLNRLVSGARFAPDEIINNLLNWLKSNTKDYTNLGAIKMLVKKIPDEDVRRLFDELPDSLKLNSTAQDINYYLENLIIGKEAPDFAQQNSDGTVVKLSDLRGKVVLIEFWASWCLPCRKETPYLKKAFKRYNNKNFTILSMSLDHKKELWMDAIKTDNLQWLNVSDLQGWDNKVSSNLYKVAEIPANFLIDSNGKIIAKNLYGKDLLIKLRKLKL